MRVSNKHHNQLHNNTNRNFFFRNIPNTFTKIVSPNQNSSTLITINIRNFSINFPYLTMNYKKLYTL